MEGLKYSWQAPLDERMDNLDNAILAINFCPLDKHYRFNQWLVLSTLQKTGFGIHFYRSLVTKPHQCFILTSTGLKAMLSITVDMLWVSDLYKVPYRSLIADVNYCGQNGIGTRDGIEKMSRTSSQLRSQIRPFPTPEESVFLLSFVLGGERIDLGNDSKL